MSKQTDSMFEIATRTQLRFDSPHGLLSIEQLWEVPLRSKNDFNLNVLATTANKALKAISEGSYVDTRKSPKQGKLELAFDIVKYVIETKLDDEKKAKKSADNSKERARLTEVLAEVQDGKLVKLSEAELKKRIAAIDD